MSEPPDPVAVAPPRESSDHATGADGASQVDLDAIELDLASVEMALRRLDEGTYFTDEVTGQPISDVVLDLDPLVRQNR